MVYMGCRTILGQNSWFVPELNALVPVLTALIIHDFVKCFNIGTDQCEILETLQRWTRLTIAPYSNDIRTVT